MLKRQISLTNRTILDSFKELYEQCENGRLLWNEGVLYSEENCRYSSKGFYPIICGKMSSVLELKFFCHCPAIIKTSVKLMLFSNCKAEEFPERFFENEDRSFVCVR